jgi:GNAT superfamily N-acetyltransferase
MVTAGGGERASWELTTDLDAFLAAAGPAMRARPAEHTLLLTITETLRIRGLDAFGSAPCFGWHGAVDGTFLHTPPHPLLLGPAPAAAMPARAAALGDRPLAGVSAPSGLGEAFAAARGGPVRLKRRERLYRLGTLVAPAHRPPGRALVATPAMRERIVELQRAFAAATGDPSQDPGGMVDDRLSHAGVMVWERPDGELVGLAGANRMVAGMVRIGTVYTPPEHRGRGIAAALTAALSQAALDAGAGDVLLFTDLANPTSNGIYRRLGYVPIADRASLEFPGP